MSSHKHLLDQLDHILESRKNASPDSSYVASLFDKGLNKILEKVGEESTEAIIAAKDYAHAPSDDASRKALVGEVADLWFHSLIMLSALDLGHNDILDELSNRFGISGHDEKAARQSD